MSANSSTCMKNEYSEYVARKLSFLLGSFAALGILLTFAVTVGSADLRMGDVFLALYSRFFSAEVSDFTYGVVWHLRLPRLLMGVVAGAGLAASGAVMQGITRNPLVSPFTIGISSAAAFGASLSIFLGAGLLRGGQVCIIGSAFLFSLLCAFAVFGLAKLRGSSPETLVLAGIAISYLFGALTAVIQFFASEEELMAIVHWSFGSTSGADWNSIGTMAAVLLLTFPLLMKYSWDLNAMMLVNDETAKSLGINASRVRTVLLSLSALLTAAIISFTGIIGFIGLVAPHLTRFLIGGDHRFLLPGTCITGSILVIAADIVGRSLIPPIVLPLGVVISFVGVPMFVYILMSRKEEFWR
ncbi:FecCD family ABC transporter permease [Methanosarcina sp. Mfa9]|uniref:FecCD family ABC transporter permease n=1 Tax=Methanosarcina sp. Mfa9 TaxID=3439063 RepID=UPI003F8443F5